ncbi:hypothetical protein ElP_75080 (plasmid) [Tautonia plasticadhaerens]|uniref:Uncharacterized protein n=1 Tax=Tautonia plasticadhaerens TaxID=2527974 RepID=A0A518HF99_9BACT|nr:hypothetical protein ElP_75080 [Tautonia plasticadhaerens]
MVPPLFVRPLTPTSIRRSGPAPLALGLHPAPLPDPGGQRRGPQALADRPPVWPPVPDRPQRPAGLRRRGTDCLREKSHRPASARPGIDDAGCERPRALLHRSPRDFGEPTSLWTPEPAAGAAFAEGLTARLVSGEAIRQALERLGVGWRRAEDWITSPGPSYLRKERA